MSRTAPARAGGVGPAGGAGGVVPLDGRRLPDSCGTKATNLAWLARKGWRVPTGVVVTAGRVAALADDAAGGTAAADATADAIRAALGDGPFAVRSSANVEDDATHTFAGQFASLLDVAPDGLVDALRAVAASAASPTVATYADRVGIDHAADIRMAVVVEQMVRPVASGVAFSRNPLSGLDEVVVECVAGRGDALVAGGVTPDRWVHRWGEFTGRPDTPRVAEPVIAQVVAETRRIAAAFKRPVDVEWVYDGTGIAWVQVRPMASLEGIGVYSNRIAREVLPGLIKPLTWSVNIPVVNGAWTDLITEAIGPNAIRPERLARQFGYRAYFDMGTLGEVFVALGMPRDSLELLLGLPGGTDRPRFKPTPATYRHLPRMLRLAWRLNGYDRRLGRELPAIEGELRRLAGEDLAALPDAALLDRVDRLMALARRAAYANIVAPLLLNAYGAMARRRATRLGIDGTRLDPALGLPGLDAYDPGRALHAVWAAADGLAPAEREQVEAGGYGALVALAEESPAAATFRAALDGFLARFGHLADSGNDLASPRWSERPDLVVAMALGHRAPAVPAAPSAGTPPAAHAPIGPDEVVGRARGMSRLVLRRLLRRAATFRLAREAVSSSYTFGFALFRTTFLEAGRRLVERGVIDEAEGVLYLALQELRSVLADTPDAPDAPRDLVAARRAEMAAAEDLDLPETILGDDFVPRRRAAAGSRVLRGVPSSRGTYRGRARVIQSLEAAGRLAPGDVLVVPFSDVAWTPLFARAGAVVAESGGMLSHSSIVAREHGIPCVVSVPAACALPDGATIHVDGFAGTVTLETTEGSAA